MKWFEAGVGWGGLGWGIKRGEWQMVVLSNQYKWERGGRKQMTKTKKFET